LGVEGVASDMATVAGGHQCIVRRARAKRLGHRARVEPCVDDSVIDQPSVLEPDGVNRS